MLVRVVHGRLCRVARWAPIRTLLVAGVYALAAVVCTYPLVFHLADALPPVPDALLHSWILAWDIHALTTNPLHLYDGNVSFPFPLSLAYSDAMLSGAAVVAPVLLITGNAVLARNLLTLGSLVLAGMGAFLLVRRLTGSHASGLVAGAIFGFCAARQAHLEHVNLLQFGWLPIALLFLHRVVQRGRASDALVFALLTVCQALASVYLAWMVAIAYFLFIAVELASRRGAWKVTSMARVAAALLLAAMVVAPLMWPYERLQQMYDFHWPADVIGDYSAAPSDYLSVPPQSVLYGGLLGQFASTRFPTEHILFPGMAALALTLVAIVRRVVDLEIVRYGLMALVAFVLSFGPELRVSPRDDAIHLPYSFLLQLVPGFGVMRVPTRFDFLVMLGLSVVAGFGVARLSQALSAAKRPLLRGSILTGVVVLTLVELLPRPKSLDPVRVGASVPEVYGWLRSQDPSAVVAEIPTRGATGYASYGYEYLSTYHWHPLVNGGSGFEPPAAKAIANQLDAFPSPAAVEDLRSLGVRFLIAHLDSLDDQAQRGLAGADLEHLGVGIAATFGSDVVYEFASPAPAPPVEETVQLGLPTLVGRAETPVVSLTLADHTAHPLFVGVPEALRVEIQWNQDHPVEVLQRELPAFLEPGDALRLGVPAALSTTVAAMDSATLRVRLTGSFESEATQTVRLDDLPSSLDRTALSAAIEQVQLPPTVRANSVIAVEVVARNTGRAVWLPDPVGTSGNPGVVGVSLRGWTAANGAAFPPSQNSTAHVPWNVSPGQASTLTMQTSTPPVPGRYTMLLDMLSESVTWFEDVNGGAPTSVPVDVEP